VDEAKPKGLGQRASQTFWDKRDRYELAPKPNDAALLLNCRIAKTETDLLYLCCKYYYVAAERESVEDCVIYGLSNHEYSIWQTITVTDMAI
jgi:hypothetical protein